MSRVIRKGLSKEERLKELMERLKGEQQRDPFGFNTQMANLSIQIIRLKKSNGIRTSDEKYQLIEMMLFHAFHMKTSIKDRYIAKKSFEKILQIDPENPEANYRYAFLHYEDGNWITAINHFKRATETNDADFPLGEDQMIKANLFIGYCSVVLAKESMQVAERLTGESEDLSSEGISIEALTLKLKRMLDRTEFMLITNKAKKLISKEEYERLPDSIEYNGVLLDLSANEPYVRSGSKSREVSLQHAFLLKKLLLANENDGALSLSDLAGYQEESISDAHDITWDNYRQKVRRINQKLVEVGLPERLIKHVPATKSYKMTNIPYYIVQNEAQ